MNIQPTKLPNLGAEHREGDTGRAFRKAGPADPIVVECPYCPGQNAESVGGLDIYPRRPDLAHKRFWRCPCCKARVGCHPPANSARGGIGDGTVPLGRLANKELRDVKQLAHAAFDPLFRNGSMRRAEAYAWLAKTLNMTADECHLGHFDVRDCWRVIEAVEARHQQ
jgi:hypothetical protein